MRALVNVLNRRHPGHGEQFDRLPENAFFRFTVHRIVSELDSSKGSFAISATAVAQGVWTNADYRATAREFVMLAPLSADDILDGIMALRLADSPEGTTPSHYYQFLKNRGRGKLWRIIPPEMNGRVLRLAPYVGLIPLIKYIGWLVVLVYLLLRMVLRQYARIDCRWTDTLQSLTYLGGKLPAFPWKLSSWSVLLLPSALAALIALGLSQAMLFYADMSFHRPQRPASMFQLEVPLWICLAIAFQWYFFIVQARMIATSRALLVNIVEQWRDSLRDEDYKPVESAVALAGC